MEILNYINYLVFFRRQNRAPCGKHKKYKLIVKNKNIIFNNKSLFRPILLYNC